MRSFGLEEKSFQSKSANFLMLLLLLLCVGVWVVAFLPTFGGLLPDGLNDQLRIDFINVGHGDASLVRTPMGKVFLIDGGSEVTLESARKAGRELTHSYLQKQNIKKLDGIVVTCWLNEHIDGLLPVMLRYKPGLIIEPPGAGVGASYDNFVEFCKNNNIARKKAYSGDVLEWGNELFVQVLNPDESKSGSDYTDRKNNSLALMIRYGKVQILFAGEAEDHALRSIMGYNDALKSQIIKVPNHGSDASDFNRFIELVSPEAAVFTVGKNYKIPLPSERTLSRYTTFGTKLYRTDKNGTIRLFVGGKDKDDYRLESDFI